MKTIVPIQSLTEDPNNARIHPERNMKAIEASLKEFGQRFPLLVRDGVVVAGNGRLAAMRCLGWTEVWIESADDMTEEEARAFALADNRTGELAEWDVNQLTAQLRGFSGEEFLSDFEGLSDILQFDEKETNELIQVCGYERGTAEPAVPSDKPVMYSVTVDFADDKSRDIFIEDVLGPSGWEYRKSTSK